MSDLYIITEPAPIIVDEGNVAEFVVEVEGVAVGYQWQYSIDNGKTWVDCLEDSAENSVLCVDASLEKDGYLYRCLVYGEEYTAVSNWGTLIVNEVQEELKITTQPISRVCQVGETVKFTIDAQGDELTYQWEFSKDSGLTWRNSTMTGAKSASIFVGGAMTRNGQMYRCVVTDNSGNVVVSNYALLSVKETAEELTDAELICSVLVANSQIVQNVYNDVHLLMVLALLTFVASCLRGWRKNTIRGSK